VQTTHERTVLSQDDVKVDLLECRQESKQLKLATGKPCAMVDENDAWPHSPGRPDGSLVNLLVPVDDRIPRERLGEGSAAVGVG
jgi:hypothetical protein